MKMQQKVYYKDYSILKQWINSKKVFLVCGKSFDNLKLSGDSVFDDCVRFSDFCPNPLYDSVVKGISLFRESACNAIVAIGGGSAIDVAKCIKAYLNSENYLTFSKDNVMPKEIPFMAVPTTAGTGSEATCFAVIYHGGNKYSVEDKACLPDTVILDAELLLGLPLYQRKVTMLDALCHAIEAYWSVKSTQESDTYSEYAIRIILKNWKKFLEGDADASEKILYAANKAGKAINIARTTVGHAMSYKLTSMYGISHGHAVALCVSVVWKFLSDFVKRDEVSEDNEYIIIKLKNLVQFFGYTEIDDAIHTFVGILSEMDIKSPNIKESDLDELVSNVNAERLSNFPIQLTKEDITRLYLELQKGYK